MIQPLYMGLGLLGEREEVPDVPLPSFVGLAALAQPLQCVLAKTGSSIL